MDVLKWDVDVTSDFAALGDRFDQLVAPMRGVRVKQSHPEFTVDFLDLAQESNQRWAARGIDRLARSRFFAPQIHSVVSRVLTDQIDLTHAFRDEAANFREHRLHCPAAMFASHLGNDAKTAGMIAALGDFYVGGMRRCQAKSRRIVIGNVSWSRVRERKVDIFIRDNSLDNRAKLFHFIEADECIDFRHFFAQLAREALRHAAAHNQLLAGTSI